MELMCKPWTPLQSRAMVVNQTYSQPIKNLISRAKEPGKSLIEYLGKQTKWEINKKNNIKETRHSSFVLPAPQHRKEPAQEKYWDSAPVLVLCFLFCLCEAESAGEIDCSLYQHSRGCMAGRHKLPIVSPVAWKRLYVHSQSSIAAYIWVFAALVAYAILQSDTASENLLHYSSGRVELPYGKHMFQCTKANLELSEELFLLCYHLCVFVAMHVFVWLCGHIFHQNYWCEENLVPLTTTERYFRLDV